MGIGASLNYAQEVHVAKTQTDPAYYTSIQSAIDAITDNATGKRYAIMVHPGVYTEKITMEDFIDLIAVGGREETTIQFTATAHDEPTLTAENALIKGFTIISDGNVGTFRTRAVDAATAGFEMEDCILTVQNSAGASDIALSATASCEIRDCVVDSTGAAITGALFTTVAQTYNVYGTRFDGATDAIQVTTAITLLNLNDCIVSDHFNQDGGTVTIVRCQMEAVTLGTAACTLTTELTRFTGAFATADAFAHTITCLKTSFSGQNFNNAATGATTINLRDCDGIVTLTNAGVGGTLNLYDCGVETLTTTQGTVVAYGGRINTCGGSSGTSFVWWKNANELQVIATMVVADALGAAASGDAIKVGPGTYAESNLTLIAGVNLVGTDPEQCIISTGDAVNPILAAGVTCAISNLTIINTNAGAPAITVTANTLTVRNCTLGGTGAGDQFAMTAGVANFYDCEFGAGDIDLSTAGCVLRMYRCRITTDPINTAGAFAHTLVFEQCDFGNQTLASAASGATTLTMRGCSNVEAVTHAGSGAFVIEDTDVDSVTASSTGTFVIRGGFLGTCAGATASVVWWKDNNLLRVVSGMTVAHALAAASAGDTIALGQGTFAESNLTAVNGVDIVGEGYDNSIIEATDNVNPIFNVGSGVTCVYRGVMISNLGTAATIAISAGAAVASLTTRECHLKSDAANSIVTVTTTAAGAPTFVASNTTFDTSANAITVTGAVVATVTVRLCYFTSCTLAFSTTGANHSFALDQCDFGGAGVTLTANAPVVTLTRCDDIGAITHSTASTVTMRECYISGTYTVGAVAGVVNADRVQFSTFTNGGSGAISFEHCHGTDINNNATSTMTIEGGNWDTVLQGAAAGTINIYGAIVATELDCSAAGAINAYDCQITTVDANGGTVTVYGGDLRDVADVTGSVLWWTSRNELTVFAGSVNMVIAQALAAAGAGDVIRVMPGTYAESNLTLIASVNLVGTDPEQCIISTGDAVNPILAAGVTCTISNLTITNSNAGAPAITITANALTVRNCVINGTGAGDALAMTAGTANLYDSTIGAGDINLSTAICTLSMYRCRITTDPVDTAGAFAHVLTFENCDFGGQNLTSAATGATTLALRGCTNIGTVSNAGSGAFTIRQSDVSAINGTSTGTYTIFGGYLGAVTRAAASAVWWKHGNELWVLPSGTSSDPMVASALAAAASGDVIKITPGTYAESNLTLVAGVNLVGTDPEQCIISTGDAGNAILNAAVTCSISGLTVTNTNAGAPAIAVTANTLTVRSCTVNGTGAGDAITMVAGVLNVYDSTVGAGDINLSTAICTLSMYRCRITTDPVDTAGAFAHVLTFENCDFGDQNLASAATGATTLAMRGCSNVGTVSNAGSGAFTIEDSDIATVTASSTGTFVITGGGIRACGGATASVTWKTQAQQYEVIAGMVIGHAITAAAADTPTPAAAAPYTVVIHPGIYAEVITCSAFVSLAGVNKDACVIEQTNANVVSLASNIEVRDLTLRIVTPTTNRNLLTDPSAISGVRIVDVIFAYTTPSTFGHNVVYLDNGSTIRLERCSCSLGGSGASSIIYITVTASTVTVVDCDFENGTSSTSGVVLHSVTAGTLVTVQNSVLSGDSALHLRASAGIIRLSNCQYRSVERTGTGDIVDESPEPKAYMYHVVRLPVESQDNIATRIAVGGGVALGGSGQLRLRINDNAVDAAGVENPADAAGALDSSFTAGRSIRYVRQVSANAFRTTTTMFFGLRATLGAAVPGMAEDHFGFIWNGTNFTASSSDGAGVGVSTNLTTPTGDIQVQLEAIQFRTGVEFYVNGVLVATHTGVGIPTAAGNLDWQEYEISDGLGGATTSDITVRQGFVAECPV